jgi:hypothetical protein
VSENIGSLRIFLAVGRSFLSGCNILLSRFFISAEQLLGISGLSPEPTYQKQIEFEILL